LIKWVHFEWRTWCFDEAHGAALDNPLKTDVVLADGRALTCSEEENEESFGQLELLAQAFAF
jgi:hypothetical protein